MRHEFTYFLNVFINLINLIPTFCNPVYLMYFEWAKTAGTGNISKWDELPKHNHRTGHLM